MSEGNVKQRSYVKDLIYSAVLIVSMLGSYYAMGTRVTVLELQKLSTDKQIEDLKAEVKTFKNLLGDVKSLTELTKTIEKTVNSIRDGLLHKGIIKPRSD